LEVAAGSKKQLQENLVSFACRWIGSQAQH
jgi:hypothetical protein